MMIFCALYKGLIPKMIKLSPGTHIAFTKLYSIIITSDGAVMFVEYEQVSLQLVNFN